MLERWGMDDRATLEEAVHAISEESAHMKELVDQLLFLARGDGGRQQFHPEPIQAEELMKEICEESEMIDHRHQYMLVQKWDGYIQADVAMIKQAIRILVDNAAKYTPEGGKITLRLELCEDGRAGLVRCIPVLHKADPYVVPAHGRHLLQRADADQYGRYEEKPAWPIHLDPQPV